MAEENIPWMIQGGKHSAASGRRVLFKATGGAEGVAAIGDLRVRQAGVANGTVIVGPGGATMVNRYPNVVGESYDGQNLTDTTVAVAANGTGATRYDLVVARIDDWNMPGGQAVPATLPTDTVKAFKIAIVSGVSAATKTAKERNLGYPAIALARIAIPAATSAVTQAMITDLREKVNPRRQRSLLTRALVAGNTDVLDTTSAAGESWPNALWVTECPDWATRVRVVARLDGVRFPASSNAYGTVWAKIGYGDAAVVNTQSVRFDAAGANNITRQSLGCADDIAIPAGLRGKSLQCGIWAQVDVGVPAGGRPSIDGGSAIVLDLEFLEAPAEDA